MAKVVFPVADACCPFLFSTCAGWAVTETGPPTWSSLTEQNCSSLDLLPNSLSGTNPALHSRCKTVQLRCLNICNIGYFTPACYSFWNTLSDPKIPALMSFSVHLEVNLFFASFFSQIQVDVLSQLLMVVHSSSKQGVSEIYFKLWRDFFKLWGLFMVGELMHQFRWLL